jgi:predicted aldo/keto reductase-like oxidoreductase
LVVKAVGPLPLGIKPQPGQWDELAFALDSRQEVLKSLPMRNREFGKTGTVTSPLGFGAMRLPMLDKKTVDVERAVPLMTRAYDLGVNYFDTGKWYCGGDSERALGEALKGMDRSRVYVSTKYAMGKPTAADLREKFEASLLALNVDYIDFYHFWGISWHSFTTELAIPGGPLEAFVRLKDEGLVRHLSFSFHSKPNDIPKLVDTGIFETMLCQYNLLDRSNEAGIAYAAAKGLGVAIMGPVGGGRLGSPSEVVSQLLAGQQRVSSPELALRFVLSNPLVSVALSGMSSLQQLEENWATAARGDALTDEELDRIAYSVRENQRMMDLYCTGCKYCEPCPEDVNISEVFRCMNYHQVWDLKEFAKHQYSQIGESEWIKGKRADACTECGTCEDKCPQLISVVEQLREAHRVLGS